MKKMQKIKNLFTLGILITLPVILIDNNKNLYEPIVSYDETINENINTTPPGVVKKIDTGGVYSVALVGNFDGTNTFYTYNDISEEIHIYEEEDLKDPISKNINGDIINFELGNENIAIISNDGNSDHLYIYGNNDNAQLGIVDESINFNEVIFLEENYKVKEVEFGYDHAGAIINNGSDHLYMWGNNGVGQLGNGELSIAIEPLDLAKEYSSFKFNELKNLSLGVANSFVTIDNVAYGWGKNDQSQTLGVQNGLIIVIEPTQIDFLKDEKVVDLKN